MSLAISSLFLPGGVDEDVDEDVLHVPDLARLDLDVGRLTARAAERLVDHDARVWAARSGGPCAPAASSTARHRRRLADAHRRHRAADVLHRVVDREAAVTTPPGLLM